MSVRVGEWHPASVRRRQGSCARRGPLGRPDWVSGDGR
jgi:hypothetical protein